LRGILRLMATYRRLVVPVGPDEKNNLPFDCCLRALHNLENR
jgi:hypothetical protein